MTDRAPEPAPEPDDEPEPRSALPGRVRLRMLDSHVLSVHWQGLTGHLTPAPRRERAT